MASFLQSLWESIFTPGPTPTLVTAANLSFAALQVVLLVLLLTTGSIHAFILSILCAGLWWAVNWFVGELAASEGFMDDQHPKSGPEPASGTSGKLQERVKRGRKDARRLVSDDGAPSDTDTEVERAKRLSRPLAAEGESGASATGVAPIQKDVGTVHRAAAAPSRPPVSPGGESGGPSASAPSDNRSGVSASEDEWEKVSEAEKDK